MAQDEHPRPQTTLEQMAKLAPVFKKRGTVTAANASVSLQLWTLSWLSYVSAIISEGIAVLCAFFLHS